MKNLLIVAVIFATAFVSCKSSKNIKSYTEKDSLAYAIGVDYGTHARRVDSTLSVPVIAAAVQDVINNKAHMTHQEAYDFINEYFSVRIPAKNKAEAEAWLSDVKAKNPNVKVTPSGLMYEIIDEGDMSVKAVEDTDHVVVGYKGTLKDGTVFDQNEEGYTTALNRVVKGWTEGVKLVGKGGEIILWLPSDLAYGERGQGQIQPNAALKFEIKVIDVLPAQPEE